MIDKELLLLNSKDLDVFIEQTQTKAKEPLEYKMNRSRQTSHFDSPLNLDHGGKWMIGLTNLEVYISFQIDISNLNFIIERKGYWENPELVNEVKTILHTKDYEIKSDEEMLIAGHTYCVADLGYVTRKKLSKD